MKIVLCTIPLWTEARKHEKIPIKIMPKIAIVSLFQWMEKFGYSAEFYDIDMLIPEDNEIYDFFKIRQPDIVGLSAIVSGSYKQVRKIAKIIREASPKAWIVLGGNLSASANIVLRKTEIDLCVLGEGEIPWVNFLDYVKKYGRKKNFKELRRIEGLSFLNNKEELEFTGYGKPIPKDEYPFPDYNILTRNLPSKKFALDHYMIEIKKYPDRWIWFANDPRSEEPHRQPRMASLWTTKGCVGRCTFCQRSVKGYKTFNLQKFDEYLRNLKEKYNVGFIEIIDESFGSNKKHAFEVAKLLKKYDLLWFCGGVRCKSFTLEELEMLKKCGCTSVKFGVESGSNKILTIMEKRFSVEDVYNALKNAHDCGFILALGIQIGMPGETDQTIIETGRYIGKIAKMAGIPPEKIIIDLFYSMPFPATPLYEYGQLKGALGKSIEDEEKHLLYVSDKVCHKEHYLNLNGQKTKTVLFWNFLMKYEAMRKFYKKTSKNMKQNESKIPQQPPEKKSFKKKLLQFLWEPISALNEKLSNEPLVVHIPRSLLYIPMRNLLFIEYEMHFLLRPLLKRVFGTKGKLIAQDLEYKLSINSCTPLSELDSLRNIVKNMREKLPPPKGLTEKNRIILGLGVK